VTTVRGLAMGELIAKIKKKTGFHFKIRWGSLKAKNMEFLICERDNAIALYI
jgi:hypothetical protein